MPRPAPRIISTTPFILGRCQNDRSEKMSDHYSARTDPLTGYELQYVAEFASRAASGSVCRLYWNCRDRYSSDFCHYRRERCKKNNYIGLRISAFSIENRFKSQIEAHCYIVVSSFFFIVEAIFCTVENRSADEKLQFFSSVKIFIFSLYVFFNFYPRLLSIAGSNKTEGVCVSSSYLNFQ